MILGSSQGRILALGATLALAGGVVAACDERERVTAPGPGPGGGGDDRGPEVTITAPAGDTTVDAGPAVFVVGRVTDPDGVDSLYIENEGGITSFPPFKHDGSDEMTFGLPFGTTGLGGTTFLVRIFAVDRDGERGDTAERQISVQ
ncbi:MAG: Ig-like domain-containing protein [Gemmatimonadales bacterium]